ncbi:uncharacterized protein [Haliotis cracherodii]|uniref:uncharacterized protein n=1 Tax=Haliotis cracherodii TaxID=6455 RepID=UPI0039E869AC
MKLLLALGLAALATAQIPIPKREVGFVYNSGSPMAPVHLDFYIDQICPDSKQAWPTILKLADTYGPSVLQLTTHLFPLPYHRNSFYASKGSHIVNQQTKGANTYLWIQTVYSNIDSLTNAVTFNLSDSHIIDKYAVIASVVGVPVATFKSLILDDTIEMDTRVEWKYCCTRGVAATPTFMLNDILVAADPSWTVAQWKQVIDPLLGVHASKRQMSTRTCPAGVKQCEYLPGKVECCKAGEFCIPNVGCRC